MSNPIIAVSTLSTFTGSGMVFANLDIATIGALVAAISSLITALVGGLIMVMNARTKNKIEEMRAHMEAQRTMSETNNRALGHIHKAINDNTVETVRSAVATDQMKQRVEQLEQKFPTQKIE